MTAPQELPIEREWWLYELTLREVGAQVDRGWKHAQFFIVLNAGIVAAVLAFLGTAAPRSFASVVLMGGVLLCLAGVLVLRENKRYYRVLAIKRAALERALGLDRNIRGTAHPLAIYALSPTADPEKLERMVSDPERYVKPKLRRGSVSDWARWSLIVIATFDVVTALALLLGWA